MNTPIKYRIRVEWPDHKNAMTGAFMKEGLTEDEARKFIDHLKREHSDKPELVQMIDEVMNSFGYCGKSTGKFNVEIYAYRERIPTNMEHMCPRRQEAFKQIHLGPDHWNQIGEDLVCSYCGSLHPESVLTIVRERGLQVIEKSTKGYKWYINRPEIHNASLGGIKYYRQHDTPEFIDSLNTIIKTPLTRRPTSQ